MDCCVLLTQFLASKKTIREAHHLPFNVDIVGCMRGRTPYHFSTHCYQKGDQLTCVCVWVTFCMICKRCGHLLAVMWHSYKSTTPSRRVVSQSCLSTKSHFHRGLSCSSATSVSLTSVYEQQNIA